MPPRGAVLVLYPFIQILLKTSVKNGILQGPCKSQLRGHADKSSGPSR